MSNRERIARAAEEAQLAAAERAAKAAKKALRPEAPRAKRAPKNVRMKIVWDVCSATGVTVETFPYDQKAAAEAATEALSQSTGRTHVLRPSKVPME